MVLAYYLPQFHPIKENNLWWGEGFTEWTNVKKAKPLFRSHQQPNEPGELGYYDLIKDEDIQIKQAALANEYGIDGFIYYQYWFGDGKMLLEKPAEKMLIDTRVNIKFCFCWANETWRGVWHGLSESEILIEQKYFGIEDYMRYFMYLLPFFKDDRYIKVDNKPMFHIYRLDHIPDQEIFFKTFNDLAVLNGFDGIYFISTGNINSPSVTQNPMVYGVVGTDVFSKMRYAQQTFFQHPRLKYLEMKIKLSLGYIENVEKRKKPVILNYRKAVKKFIAKFPHNKYIQCVFPNWDNSPRSNNRSLIFKNSTPDAWERHFIKAIHQLKANPSAPQIIIIKSWNEWAEGNYLEPDKKYGRRWLEAVRNSRTQFNF